MENLIHECHINYTNNECGKGKRNRFTFFMLKFIQTGTRTFYYYKSVRMIKSTSKLLFN